MTEPKNVNYEEKINQGFDRGVDLKDIKNKLLKHTNKIFSDYEIDKATHNDMKRLAYLLIAIIQLRNGSRISEACKAFKKFINIDDIDKGCKVVVKISKSEKKQYNNRKKEFMNTKPRFREMVFPDWINMKIFNTIREHKIIDNIVNRDDFLLTQRVRDILLKYHNCNTHSLRYALINYMLHDLKVPINEVAKFVGHKNTNQICTYTQNKNVKKLFDIDI